LITVWLHFSVVEKNEHKIPDYTFPLSLYMEKIRQNGKK